jgi:hypothetical protein
MKMKCLGCGNEYEGEEGDLCPRDVGNGKTCACLYAILETPKRARKGSTVEMTEGGDHGGN